nr:hypothetical protein [Pseudomonadota bacterium]
MKRQLRLAPLALLLLALAQAPHAQTTERTAEAGSAVKSELDAQLFYQLLLGEINATESDAGAGYSIILDAARK